MPPIVLKMKNKTKTLMATGDHTVYYVDKHASILGKRKKSDYMRVYLRQVENATSCL